MKKLSFIIILLAVATTISASLVFYNSVGIVEEVATAIKTGNSTNVSKYFNSTLDLTVPGSEGTYSKVQAEMILKDFFSKNAPKSFLINHQGASNDGSLYAIGTYTSATAALRTYFLLKKSGTTYLIQKLEFEEN